MLNDAQRATLKTAVLADPVLSVLAIDGNLTGLESALNAAASPDYIVWKNSVATNEVGVAVSYIAVEAMTDANRTRITTFYAMNPESFEPRADIRSFWANTFSGALGGQGQATRDALDALWRRKATVLEKIYASGSGTTLSPSSLAVEGSISWTELAEINWLT